MFGLVSGVRDDDRNAVTDENSLDEIILQKTFKMRIRTLSAVFWICCISVFTFIMFMVMDLPFAIPSIGPTVQVQRDEWLEFQSELYQVENQLKQHHAIVKELKNAVNHIEYNAYQAEERVEEENAVLKEPPKQVVEKPVHIIVEDPEIALETNISFCPVKNEVWPKTDVQMLAMYDRISFDDVDGGVWKQGWNVEYDEKQWSHANRLRVFIVPHSHNDPGWLKTFENYYKTHTKAIFNNMVEKLGEVPGRTFIWCETSYLSLWWTTDATEKDKAAFLKLLKSGNIEIVTGGWVMNDEANSHWLSIIQQLTTGHQWLLEHLEYIPKNHWSIDPFGYSSSQPYILKLAGMENSVIQRVHYRIKKELAMNKELEFNWRQLWDGVGITDMFTHMMPFYFYDIPHTCGPDPKVCCQFDFKRLPGNGVNCPWGIPPLKIIQKNVQERAFLILDQWRKKAQLYRSNVVLIPLGDDFRYDKTNEWDDQFQNYEALIDYINNKNEWNAEVQFGTLEDYFKAVHKEMESSEFPVLSGDFFTYADRNKHYWSGYYTSRPFYKSMDRVLLAYVRAAEIISSQAVASGVVTRVRALQLRDRCEQARRALSLFQHHDGVTGTSRDEVREDYAKKMLQAIKYSQSAIQQAAFHLLGQPQVLEQTQEDVYFDVDDIWKSHDEIPARITISLDATSASRRVVLYNALNFARTDLLTLLVNTPHIEVFDSLGEPMMAQISPVVTAEKRLGFAPNKFQLIFPATVPPLGLAQYTVALRDSMTPSKHTSYTRIRIYNADYWTVDLPEMFAVDMPTARLEDDVIVSSGNGTGIVCTKKGLLKAVTLPEGENFLLAMDFVQYFSIKEPDNNSGAYLFMPSGPGETVQHDAYPEIVILEGLFKSSLYTGLVTPRALELVMELSVHNNPTLPQAEVWVTNTFLIDPKVTDLEVGMRVSTRIDNGDVFYTDLNGMQMIKRRYFEKLPLQANFYPLPAAAYIQDERHRLTLLTSTPLGMAALQPGQVQVMHDRRLNRDDNRGINQGVMDNVRTRHTFKLIVEEANKPCANEEASSDGHGQLSLGAHVSAQTLLQPLVAMHYSPARESTPVPLEIRSPRSQADIVLATSHAFVSAKTADGNTIQGIGITFQRVHLDFCFGNKDIGKWYPVGDGQIELRDYVDVSARQVFPSSLTFNSVRAPAADTALQLCPMEVRAVLLQHDIHKH